MSRTRPILRLAFGLCALAPAAVAASGCPSPAATHAVVHQFAHLLLVEKDPARAYAAFAAPDLVQRNPPFGTTRESTVAQWRTMTERPASSFRVVSIRWRGDVAHIRFIGSLGPGQRARVDQHDRFRCGRIVEEWASFKVLENAPPPAG